jgi:hypothetical protein
MAQDPPDGVRNVGTFQKGLHRRRYTDEYVYALAETQVVDFYGLSVHTVSYVDMATGATFVVPYGGNDLPLEFDTDQAWTDGVFTLLDLQHEGTPLPRFEPVEPPIPPPLPPIQVVDAIRVCLQLSTAIIDMNGWWYDVLGRMTVIMQILNTPVSMSKLAVLATLDIDYNGEPRGDTLAPEDHQTVYLGIANDLMVEADLVVT